MKKFFNYATTLVLLAVCTFGISSCGNDDDDLLKPGSMFGDWVSMTLQQNGNLLSLEIDNFNGNAVIGTVYKVYGTNIMQNMELNERAITKIEKYVNYGTFSYSGDNLSITWPEGTFSGSISFSNNGSDAVWRNQATTLNMGRPSGKVSTLVSRIETLYRLYFAGK